VAKEESRKKKKKKEKEKGKKEKEQASIWGIRGPCTRISIHDTYRHEGDCVTHRHELTSNAHASKKKIL
jgi:hypothetical protein